jgi:hypothetical protein
MLPTVGEIQTPNRAAIEFISAIRTRSKACKPPSVWRNCVNTCSILKCVTVPTPRLAKEKSATEFSQFSCYLEFEIKHTSTRSSQSFERHSPWPCRAIEKS